MSIHDLYEQQTAQLKEALSFIESNLPYNEYPSMAIVCGSGLQKLSEALTNPLTLEYKDIPHFAINTVAGHVGRLVFGLLNGIPTVCMVGRFHPYEGHSMFQVTFPIRIFAMLGVKVLVVTNASGALNTSYSIGDIMMINDHINMPGMCGPRFPAMTDCYDEMLRKFLSQAAAAKSMSQHLREGVYCFVSGPSYETKAEARFLRATGGDVVGMSTVPEVVVARHAGMRVLGLALVTNKVVMEDSPHMVKPTHEEVLQVSKERANDMQALVVEFVNILKNSEDFSDA